MSKKRSKPKASAIRTATRPSQEPKGNASSPSTSMKEKNPTHQGKYSPFTTFLKKLTPDLLAIAFFYAIVTIYFAPSILDGNVIQQPDIQQSGGMMKDMVEAAKTAEDSEVIAWTGALYGGMPNYLIYTHGLPDNYTQLIDNWIVGFDPLGGSIILIALLTFYLFMRSIGITPILSAIGSVGFAFASYNFIIIEAGHVNKGYVMAYMPLTIAGMWLLNEEKWKLGFLFFLLGVTLSLAWGHPQITYYLFLFCLFLYAGIVTTNLREKTYSKLAKMTGLFAIASLLAISPNVGKLYASWELGKSTLRGPSELTITPQGQALDEPEQGLTKDYAFMWSYGKSELLTWLIPNAYGGKSAGFLDNESRLHQELRRRGANVGQQVQTYTYWGDKPSTSGPVYFGAVICFLAIFGLAYYKHPLKWWMFGGALFLTLLSFGKNLDGFNTFMFEHLPLYNKFRTVEMALVIPGLFAPIIALLGLHKVLTQFNHNNLNLQELKKALYIATGLTGGLALIVLTLPELLLSFRSPLDGNYNLPDWYYSALITDRKSLAQADAIRSLILILIAAGSLFALTLKKSKPQLKWAIPLILLALTLGDLWDVNRRYLNDENYSAQQIQTQQAETQPEEPFKPTLADEIILQDKELGFRVLNLNGTFFDNQTPYFHRSVGGYHPAKLRRTSELIDFYMQKEINLIINTLQSTQSLEATQQAFANTPILNMLNTKYVIYNPDQPPILNKSAYGSAWFVDDLRVVESADEEILALGEINPRTTAAIRERDVTEIDDSTPFLKSTVSASGGEKNLSENSIILTSYKPHKLTYQVSLEESKFTVFSEVDYQPGWRAYKVNTEIEEPLEIIQSNYKLRGVQLPAGEYEIHFEFEPEPLIKMHQLASVSSILILAIVWSLIGWMIFLTLRLQLTPMNVRNDLDT